MLSPTTHPGEVDTGAWRWWRHLVGLALVFLICSGAAALETDQYYAWGRPLEDSAGVLNAKLDLELKLAVDEVNRHPDAIPTRCDEVSGQFRKRLHFTTFQNLELWALKSEMLTRVPADPAEELEYRRVNLYHNHSLFDAGTWLPDSPTMEVDGIRFGTDKLAHFISSGWRWYQSYLGGRDHGLTPAEAEQQAIRDGLFWERTMLGMVSSGVLSRGDLEADYQGLQFFRDLCEGGTPTLTLEHGQWQVARPVDIRRYVSPEWDESYHTSIYSKSRWRKVKPVLETYCDRLALPSVQAQRAAYARRDRVTPVDEFVAELVRQGKLPDPSTFSIETTCAELGFTVPPPPPMTPPERAPPAGTEPNTELMEELARRDADRRARGVGLVGFQIDHPEKLSASIGAMWVALPREYDCTTVCSFQGLTLQLAVGLGGGRASLGWARVVGDELGARPFVTDPYVGIGLRGTLLYTWGDPSHEPPGAAFLGGEFEFTMVQVSFRLGVFHHVGGADHGGPWLLAGGIGWGF